MAFRRKTRRFKRPFRAKLARRRKTWYQFNLDPCNPLILEHCPADDGCCTDKAAIELLGNQQLQDLFSDRASVVRVLGDLWFVDNMGTITSPGDIRAWLQYLGSKQEFLGLRRGEITSQAPTMPLSDIWDTNFDDLSEGQWFKTWQNFHTAFSDFGVGDMSSLASGWSMFFPVRGSDVHTHIASVESCNPLTSGTGDICIETDFEDDCLECGQALNQGQVNFTQTSLDAPRPWHVHLDVKKRISLRENQGLYLLYNLRHWLTPPPLSADSFTAIYGNVRLLIEMG